MDSSAYIIGSLNKETGLVVAGLVGEPSPTTSFKIFTFVILSASGKDYEEAVHKLGQLLNTSHYSWILKFLNAADRSRLQRGDPK